MSDHDDLKKADEDLHRHTEDIRKKTEEFRQAFMEMLTTVVHGFHAVSVLTLVLFLVLLGSSFNEAALAEMAKRTWFTRVALSMSLIIAFFSLACAKVARTELKLSNEEHERSELHRRRADATYAQALESREKTLADLARMRREMGIMAAAEKPTQKPS